MCPSTSPTVHPTARAINLSTARAVWALGTVADGWTRRRAEEELANVLADVRRGIWKPSQPPSTVKEPGAEPTFHRFASAWLEPGQHEFAAGTVEDYTLALIHHLLPFFASHKLSRDHGSGGRALQAFKVRERELDSSSGR